MKTLFTVLFCLGFCFVQAQDKGAILVEKPEHPFGEMQEGTQAAHTFVFKNTGKADLKLKAVRPSCGCTTPAFTQTAIKPNETGEIKVVFNSTGRVGDFYKQIVVETDGNPEIVVLTITGQVKPLTLAQSAFRQGALAFDQANMDLGVVTIGNDAHKRLYVQNLTALPIKILKASSNHPDVSFSLPKNALFKDDLNVIQISLPTTSFKAGEVFDIAITLETTDTATPKKTLRLSGLALAKVE